MPAGVAVMPAGLRETSVVRKRPLLVGAASAGACGSSGAVHRADIIEQFLEKALLAAERGREALRRIDVQHQLLAGILDRRDVALWIEAHKRDLLLGDPWVTEGELVGVARHI